MILPISLSLAFYWGKYLILSLERKVDMKVSVGGTAAWMCLETGPVKKS